MKTDEPTDKNGHKTKMKKNFLLLLMCIITSYAVSQNAVNFIIDSEGVFHVPESEKDYYVFNFPGKTASQLYNSALKAATKTYTSTDDNIKKVQNQMITITSSCRHQEEMLFGVISYRKVFYAYDIEFKAGRIRINSPRVIKVMLHHDDEDEEEQPFSYIVIRNTTIMNKWFSPMNVSINKLLSAMSDKKDENW